MSEPRKSVSEELRELSAHFVRLNTDSDSAKMLTRAADEIDRLTAAKSGVGITDEMVERACAASMPKGQWAAWQIPDFDPTREDRVNRTRRNMRAAITAAIGKVDATALELPWRDGATAPEDGTEIIVGVSYRYQLYKPEGQRQMKVRGRWQVMGEFGWENAPKPDRWLCASPPTSDGGGE